MDDSISVRSLKRRVREFSDARDWAKFHDPKNLSAAISIEAAELQELFLWKSKKEIGSLLKNTKKRVAVADEMADIGILLLSLADILEIDFGQAILDKLKTNEARYPIELSKGSSTKYTELTQ